MKTQSFSNHVRKHPFYHYFMLRFTLLLIVVAGLNMFMDFNLQTLLILLVSVFLHLLAFLSRDYAKKNQDRIIRLELRLRYWQLTGRNFEQIENKFQRSQLLALRFASDEEFLAFLENSGVRNASAQDIKQQIRVWVPDTMRV